MSQGIFWTIFNPIMCWIWDLRQLCFFFFFLIRGHGYLLETNRPYHQCIIIHMSILPDAPHRAFSSSMHNKLIYGSLMIRSSMHAHTLTSTSTTCFLALLPKCRKSHSGFWWVIFVMSIFSMSFRNGREESWTLYGFQIVDSVIALFRVDFTGRGELAERQVSSRTTVIFMFLCMICFPILIIQIPACPDKLILVLQV